MQHRDSLAPSRSSVPLSALALLALVPQDGRVVKLNAPLPRPTVAALRDVVLAPSGERAVFTGDLGTDEVFELYSVPVDGGGAALRLSRPLPDDGDVWQFQLAGAGSLLVYAAEQRTNDVRELYSVPIDGSRLPLRLSRTPAPGGNGVDSFRISANGLRVAYLSDQETAHVRELFGTSIEWFADDVKLNGPLTSGGSVVEFELTADGSHAVYLADQDTDGVFELYAVAPDLTRVKLNQLMPPAGDVSAASNGAAFGISPDGTRVVYRADHAFDEYFALFSVPIDASLPPVRLSAPLASGESVSTFQIDSGSRRVLFGVSGKLYSAPLDGSAPAVLLSAPGDGVQRFQISPDGSRAVFTVFRHSTWIELHSAPMDGSAAPTRLDPPPNGEVRDFVIRPDSTGVVFRTRYGGQEPNPLFSVPITGGALPTPLGPDSDSHYSVLPDSTRVLFIGHGTTGQWALFQVPSDGSAAPMALSGPPVPTGYISSFQLSHDGATVLYLATQEIATVLEAFAVPSDGSAPAVKVSPPLPPGPIAGDVNAFALTSDGVGVVYSADQEEVGKRELYGVPIDARTPPLKLSGGAEVQNFVLSPDGTRAAHVSGDEAFVEPIDGSAAPMRLAGWDSGYDAEIRVSPDDRHLLYRPFYLVSVPPYGFRKEFEQLFSVPMDGSAPAAPLSGIRVLEYDFDALSYRVVYIQGRELFSHRVDGTPSIAYLNGPLVAEGAVLAFRIAPDAARVAYLADQETDGLDELYGVPIDRSTPPYKLSLQASGAGVTAFRITADSTRVVFVQETPTGARLFSRALDGTGPVLTLASLTGTTSSLEVTPQGLAVYSVYVGATETDALFSVPVDGSAPPLELRDDAAQDFRVSADGQWVVFPYRGVASVRADGSQPSLQLSPPEHSSVSSFGLSADSSTVAYAWHDSLYRVPIDGSVGAVRATPDLVPRGDVRSFVLSRDGTTIVYVADQEEDDAFELFAAHHFGYRRPAAGPTDAGSRPAH